MLGEGYGSPENVLQVLKRCSWAKKITKRDADDDKRALMTMNEGEGIYHTPLHGISRGFAETSRSTCRNICRHRGVRVKTYVEYVQSMCSVRAKWERGYGPRSLEGGL